jgi:uncharacterized cupin superfamily protein
MPAEGFTIKHLDDFEKNGRWSLVRRGLDVQAFGLNIVEIEQGYSIPEHNELDRDQEEVFIVLEGSPSLVVDGREIETPAGTFARLDPGLQRTVVNRGEDVAAVLIVSAPRTSGYEPMEWA